MVIHVTKPDVEWLRKLLTITEEIHEDYPELFSATDEEILLITKQLIKDLNL